MVNHSSLVETESQQKLAKLKMLRELQKNSIQNTRILPKGGRYHPEITDKVHAVKKNISANERVKHEP